MSAASDLISYIETASNIIADANTFVYVRAEMPDALAENENLGGGNLLMCLGLFTVIGYLAKIYAVLKNPDAPITQEQNNQARELIKPFSKTPASKAIEVKRTGSINETMAFKQLIIDCPGLNFNLNSDELFKIWDGLRNNLVHMSTVKQGITALTRMGGKDFSTAKMDANNFNIVFTKKSDGGVFVNVDILIEKVNKIKDWLIGEIDKGTYDNKNIDLTLEWLKSFE